MGEIFKLFGTIGINNQAANKSLDETEKKGSTTAKKLTGFFSNLSNKIGASLSGIGQKLDFKGMNIQFNKLGGSINLALSTGIKNGANFIASSGTAIMQSAGATLVKSMNLAGELEQNLGSSEAIFGKYADQMQKNGVNAFKTMGLSQSEFLQNANKIGSLYQGAGFSVQESMSLTGDAMQRAGDMASVMGVDIDTAMAAVGGMAEGNFEMMDNLGVAMNDTTIGNYALSKGIQQSTQQMTTQEKVGLATQLFMEKTAKYAGNYSKENDTLAGSLQTAKGALSNFMSGAGTIDEVLSSGMDFAKIAGNSAKELAPKLFEGITKAIQEMIPKLPSIMNGLANGMADVIGNMFGEEVKSKFEGLVDLLSETFTGLKSSFDFFVKYKDVFVPIAVGIGTVIGVLSTWNVITKVATAVQLAFNTATKANIFGVIALAIAGVVAALVYFFTQTKTGTAIWQSFSSMIMGVWTAIKDNAVAIFNGIASFLSNLWNGIKSVASTIWNLIQSTITTIIQNWITSLTSIFQFFASALSGIWAGITSVASTVWNVIKATIATIVQVAVNLVVSIFNGLRNTISGIWNGIRNVASTVWNGIKNTVSSIVSGVVSVATNLFNGMRNTISGIWNGIHSTISNIVNGVKNTISNVWSSLSNTVSGIFDGVRRAVEGPMNTMKKFISGIIDTIKGLFNFNIKFPSIKLPQFRIKNGSINPLDWIKNGPPSLEFFAKGGILTQPTFFGMNGPNPMIGGEAGAEAVAPIDTLLGYVKTAVNEVIGDQKDGDINVTQYISSPEPLTPREIARETKLRLQDLATLK